jgi:hypothetical protein
MPFGESPWYQQGSGPTKNGPGYGARNNYKSAAASVAVPRAMKFASGYRLSEIIVQLTETFTPPGATQGADWFVAPARQFGAAPIHGAAGHGVALRRR